MNNKTSYGQTLMRDLIQNNTSAQFFENYRPDWLFGMELDFYFEAHNLAIEFQGGQHFVPVHGYGDLWAQRRRDSAKRKICKERGIKLLRLDASELTTERIRFKLKRNGVLLKKRKGSKSFKPAIEYRALLRDNFNCPTAHKKGSAPRQEVMFTAFVQ